MPPRASKRSKSTPSSPGTTPGAVTPRSGTQSSRRPEIDEDGESAGTLAEQGSAPTSSSASSQHPDQKIEDFYECCIRPFVPSDIQQSIDNVEWDVIGPLLSQACHKLELRKPGEDCHLRDLLDGSLIMSST